MTRRHACVALINGLLARTGRGQTSVASSEGAAASSSETASEEFRVYTEHPRLLLNRQRLRLLKRERERQSVRWQQFELLIAGRAQMPEPGFALALYHRITDDRQVGRQAIDWALGSGSDPRQVALVFDWCFPLLSPAEVKRLVAALARTLVSGPDLKATAARNAVFAAIALADHPDQELTEKTLSAIVAKWWRGGTAASLNSGRLNLPHAEVYATMELLHAVRDNLNIELRDHAGAWFTELPLSMLLSYYPAAWPAAENDYRISMFDTGKEPDLAAAAMSRIAELALVAYDSNARNAQFLQGWLMNDRFALRSTMGSPYELLWANPYLPGLSYHHMPLFFHDRKRGELYARSTWDEDAVWLGYRRGKAQVFRDGRLFSLAPRSKDTGIAIGDTSIIAGGMPMRLERREGDPANMFLVGLAPSRTYEIEVDDEELAELTSDPGGILPVLSTRTDARTIRIRSRM